MKLPHRVRTGIYACCVHACACCACVRMFVCLISCTVGALPPGLSIRHLLDLTGRPPKGVSFLFPRDGSSIKVPSFSVFARAYFDIVLCVHSGKNLICWGAFRVLVHTCIHTQVIPNRPISVLIRYFLGRDVEEQVCRKDLSRAQNQTVLTLQTMYLLRLIGTKIPNHNDHVGYKKNIRHIPSTQSHVMVIENLKETLFNQHTRALHGNQNNS